MLPEGRVWLFVTGLLAPILFALKRIGEWLARMIGGSLFSDGLVDELEKRNEELARRLAALEAAVHTLRRERDEALGREYDNLQSLENEAARIRDRIAEKNAQLAEPSEVDLPSPGDLLERERRRPGFFELDDCPTKTR